MKTKQLNQTLFTMVAILASGSAWAQSTHLPGGTPAIEVLEPVHQARLSAVPVRFKLKFNFPVLGSSLNASLNGNDVSAKFTIAANEATAVLSLQDGLRPNLGKDGQLFAPNLLQVRASASDSRRHYQATRHFFLNSPDNPSTTTGTVTPDGGQVSLPSVATVSFPAGAFLANQDVEVSVTSDPKTSAVFDETSVMFAVGVRTPFEIRIRTGANQTLTDFTVTFELPEAFRLSVPPDAEIRVFGQNLWQGETGEILDTFELFPARFLPTDTTATVTLPRSLFTSQRPPAGVFEAVLTLGTTPTRQVTEHGGYPRENGPGWGPRNHDRLEADPTGL